MIYSHRHNSPQKRLARVVGIVFAVAVLLIGLIQWRAPQLFPGLAASMARPFWRAEFAIKSGSLRSSQDLLAENESLKRELESFRLSIASTSISLLFDENAELRSILGRASTTPRTLAAVLARPPHAPYDELIIDLGRRDGVTETTMVYAPGEVLIGRVSAVFSETSSVRLFSSSGTTYDVFIGSTNIPATAIGRGGGYYVAELPHGTAAVAGDTVSDSAGLGNGIFGNVISVSNDPSSTFDQALIAPPINIFGLRWVLLDITP